MSVGLPDPIVVGPVALVTLAEDAGLTGGDCLFQAAPQLHHVQQGEGEVVDLLTGVDFALLCEAGVIVAGGSRRLGSTSHLTECWHYIANLTRALEASERTISVLRATIAEAQQARLSHG